MSDAGRWALFAHAGCKPTGSRHVLPLGDLIEHDTSTTCPCKPQRLPDGQILHPSLDLREYAEPDHVDPLTLPLATAGN